MLYLDANATSRLRPEAAKIVADFIAEAGLRNPSSVHELGRRSRARLVAAREHILRACGFEPGDKARLIFTSGGTEACNSMILGFLGRPLHLGQMRGRVITSSIEHPAVLETLEMLEQAGWEVVRVNPSADGLLHVEDCSAALSDNTALVCLMSGNNETGALQPVAEIASALRSKGYRGPIVSDFTQCVGKSTRSVKQLFAAGVNAVAISGHKVGAPAGIGAMIISEDSSSQCFTFEPLLRGGPQEGGFRAGTENAFGALAFGEACRIITKDGEAGILRRRALRDRLWMKLSEGVKAERITPFDTNNELSLANTLAVRFPGCRGDDLVVALDLNGLCVSTGSACASGKQGVSHVMTAMGFDQTRSREMIRISLDWDANEQLVDNAAEIIRQTVSTMLGELNSAESVS